MNCLKSRYNTKRWRRKKQHNVVLIKKKNETKQNDANAKDLAIKVKQYRRQKKKKRKLSRDFKKYWQDYKEQQAHNLPLTLL